MFSIVSIFYNDNFMKLVVKEIREFMSKFKMGFWWWDIVCMFCLLVVVFFVNLSGVFLWGFCVVWGFLEDLFVEMEIVRK